MVETARLSLTTEDPAILLSAAREEMKLTLKGEWAFALAKARYTDVMRYQSGITIEGCGELYELASNLVRKAHEGEDKAGAEYFGRIAEGWARLGFLLHTEPTRV